jgi:hypothetical protein
MVRIAVAAVLLGSLTTTAPAAPPVQRVSEGRIEDVRGTSGTLTLTRDGAGQAGDRTFDIRHARIVGPGGAEWKVGDLQVGDRVRVVLAPGRTIVQEVRVVLVRTRPLTNAEPRYFTRSSGPDR